MNGNGGKLKVRQHLQLNFLNRIFISGFWNLDAFDNVCFLSALPDIFLMILFEFLSVESVQIPILFMI